MCFIMASSKWIEEFPALLFPDPLDGFAPSAFRSRTEGTAEGVVGPCQVVGGCFESVGIDRQKTCWNIFSRVSKSQLGPLTVKNRRIFAVVVIGREAWEFPPWQQ